MIVFDHVSFGYGTRPILQDVTFSIGSSEKVAILGGSGDGKTTLLKLIMGLLTPDSGTVMIDGEDITSRSEEEMKDVRLKFSIVFQEGALFDSLNVKENVAFFLREYTRMQEEKIDQRVRELLRKVGLEHAASLMPEELSGGMNRRVAIVRSLAASDPRMFLYDEPTAGLDPVNADIICRLVVDLADHRRGFIIVTHKIYDAVKVANRFMFLKGGRILFDGDKPSLMTSLLPEIQTFTAELNPASTSEETGPSE